MIYIIQGTFVAIFILCFAHIIYQLIEDGKDDK